MQPHVHANPRPARILLPPACSKTTQGPAHAHDRHMLPARQHQPCGTGYKGLQRATQNANSPSKCHIMHQVSTSRTVPSCHHHRPADAPLTFVRGTVKDRYGGGWSTLV